MAVAARAADPVIVSAWAPSAVSVDGSLLEWSTLNPIEKGLEVAVANDGTSVYVAVLASDAQMRVSLSRGIVLYVDPTGKHKETFGLQLPGPPHFDPAASGRVDASRLRLTPTVSDHIDVLGPGKLERRLIDLDPSSGIAVATGGEDGGIVFEVRIPLASSPSERLALSVDAKRTFGLGIATPPKRPGTKEAADPFYWIDPYASVRMTSGMGDPNFRTAPLPDSSNRPEKEVKPKDFESWVVVRLADK
jgi:hypothetical protein